MYDLASTLEPDDQKKAIAALRALLGLGTSNPEGDESGDVGGSGSGSGDAKDAAGFFSSKEPKNKGEELAVAARYRELKQDASEHEKEELEKVVRAARRNFDSKNYSRDIDNARRKGLFNHGTPTTLSYFGQEYVDALPDREKVKSIPSPGRRRRKAAARKKPARKR